MAYYQSERTMKAAAIGTIMPWSGDIGLIPKGWLICSGQTIVAAEFPLLSQVIGTTYSPGGALGFGGTFPNYTGSIQLPQLNDKHLANIDTAYFVSGQTVDNTGIDNAEALNVVQNYIGTNESSSTLPTLVTDAYTDIVLNYTPENDFTGTLTGNTIINGESERLIYTSPRKLGRRHVAAHNHPGTYPSISGNQNDRPGKGVIPWATVTFNVKDYFAYGLFGGPEYNFNATSGPSNGFGGTSLGKVLANVQSSDNASGGNVIANNVAGANAHPISNWLGNSSGKSISNTWNWGSSADGKLEISESVPYGIGGSNVTIPQRNYDPGGTNSGVADANTSGNKALYNKSSIDFNYNTTSDTDSSKKYIAPHTHETFDVVYKPANLKLPNKTSVNTVASNITPQNIVGESALNITAVTTQPNMICVYLIRAY